MLLAVLKVTIKVGQLKVFLEKRKMSYTKPLVSINTFLAKLFEIIFYNDLYTNLDGMLNLN